MHPKIQNSIQFLKRHPKRRVQFLVLNKVSWTNFSNNLVYLSYLTSFLTEAFPTGAGLVLFPGATLAKGFWENSPSSSEKQYGSLLSSSSSSRSSSSSSRSSSRSSSSSSSSSSESSSCSGSGITNSTKVEWCTNWQCHCNSYFSLVFVKQFKNLPSEKAS